MSRVRGERSGFDDVRSVLYLMLVISLLLLKVAHLRLTRCHAFPRNYYLANHALDAAAKRDF